MYLTNLLVLNSGALTDFELTPEFHADGRPKPLVLVGGNGCGKTTILSVLADALVEIAAQHFADIMPQRGQGRAYYRLLGPATIRLGSPFELSAARFVHGGSAFGYRAIVGTATSEVSSRLSFLPELSNLPDGQSDKTVVGDTGQVQAIFRSGAYCFLPANRSEAPGWLNPEIDLPEPAASFQTTFTDKLRKPVVATSTLNDTKAWLIDLILDQSLDPIIVINQIRKGGVGLAELTSDLNSSIQQTSALSAVNKIIQAILKEPTARVVRAGRAAHDRKIHIQIGADRAIPTLDSLSAGQSTLLSIFCTILRYGDLGRAGVTSETIEGIVVVDEIDAHLHSDLQHDVLPALLNMFPRVQFVLTSHSPLFPLGMEKMLTPDGFTLVELPSGTRIGAERFSEFEASYQYLRETKAFEEDIRSNLSHRERPSIICEGETDPIYLKAAAELLGFTDLAKAVDFDWIGQRTGAGAEGGGKDELAKAQRVLMLNPSLARTRLILLYDADARKPDAQSGNVWVMSFPDNSSNTHANGGVEVLLPDSVFEERFYKTTERLSGTTRSTKIELAKMDLCRFVCTERRDPNDFALFQPILQKIADTLSIAPQA